MRIKNIFFILFLAILHHIAYGQNDWTKIPFEIDPVVCYSSGKVEKSFIPTSMSVLNKIKNGNLKKSEIIVSYNNFPDIAKNAFEYGIEIWENFIDSDVPIYISATWESMGENALASCKPSAYYMNFNNVRYSDRCYPIAVAEKILGYEISSSDSPDIISSFNKDIEWYFGIDGQAPEDKYDFVTSVIHEVAHGLGFMSFFYENEGNGGYYSPPSIFDEFIVDIQNKSLINSEYYDNPSKKLLNALTSEALYFKSPVTMFDSGKSLPVLFAPSPWHYGASLTHLKDEVYPAGDINSLMTHECGMGEAIHDPGPHTLNILADLGWKNTSIEHSELRDREPGLEPVFFEASIISDYELDSTSLYVYYSSDSFNNSDSLLLKVNENKTFFSSRLPDEVSSGIISYYIMVTDEKQRIYKIPENAPLSYFEFNIAPDIISPTVVHNPESYLLDNMTELLINVSAYDNIGLDSVWIEYFLNDQDISVIKLKNESGSLYSGIIDLLSLQINDQDIFRYRIVAKDSSQNQNLTSLPSEGYFALKVESIYDPVYEYVNKFNEINNDFIYIGFEQKTENGFTDGAFHSLHPYASTGQNGMYYNYEAKLKYPVILLEDAQMNFDEIVLVEPGEPDSKYGDPGFKDYVIIEGSKNSGQTWFPFVNGYDSRCNSLWETEFNNGINNNGNSEAIGIKDMFINRNIDMLASGDFLVGDTVEIRFRLYSDSYVNGWGWSIDNLGIQKVVSDNKKLFASPENFRIYPNPFNKNIFVESNSKTYFEKVNIAVYDSFGRQILMETIDNVSFGVKYEMNLNMIKSGMYFIHLFTGEQQILRQKIIK